MKPQPNNYVFIALIALTLAILSCTLPGMGLLDTGEDEAEMAGLNQTATVLALEALNFQATQAQAAINAASAATAEAQAIQSTATAQAQALQATATAQAYAAQATATAQARLDAIMNYAYFDSFNSNIYDWREDQEDNDYWAGRTSIINGIYAWDITTVYDNFVSWGDFEEFDTLGDFDVAIRGRLVAGDSNEHCYGILFRKSPDGFDSGSYSLSICESGYFKLAYHDGEGGWQDITEWVESDAIIEGDWNLIEVNARGSNYKVYINHQQVADVVDPRLTGGQVSILIDIYELTPGRIEFDFFALQPR